MDDTAIIGLFWKRDENAIGETKKKYSGYCLAIARNILQNRSDEEEYLNDTWFKAWNSIPPHRPNCLRVYLRKIARNLSLNILKNHAAKKRTDLFLSSLEELSECIPDKGSPQEDFEAKNLVTVLNGFLNTLPKDERIVFLRRYWYCYSIKAIAKSTGFSESKIKSMLFRLRNNLKICLEKEDYFV